MGMAQGADAGLDPPSPSAGTGLGASSKDTVSLSHRGFWCMGLPSDMPKAWFMALASLSKAATPKRIDVNAHSDRIRVVPNLKGRK